MVGDIDNKKSTTGYVYTLSGATINCVSNYFYKE